MKNYEEMAKLALEARDEHIRRKKKRAATMKVILPVSASFCFAALIGFGFLNNKDDLSHIQDIPINTGSEAPAVSATTTEAKATAAGTATPITAANTRTTGASSVEAAAVVTSRTSAATARTEIRGSSANAVTTQVIPQTVQTSEATRTKRPDVTTSIFIPPWHGGLGGATTVDLSQSETTDTTTTETTQTTAAVTTASDVMSKDDL